MELRFAYEVQFSMPLVSLKPLKSSFNFLIGNFAVYDVIST